MAEKDLLRSSGVFLTMLFSTDCALMISEKRGRGRLQTETDIK